MNWMKLGALALFCFAGMLLPADMDAQVTHLTKEQFLEKVFDYRAEGWTFQGEQPVIVDFYATWCAPCRRLAPILEELAKEYEGQLTIYKVDVDAQRELASDFEITSIPTLLFVPLEGDPRIVQGGMPKKQLKEIIDEFLLK